MDLDNDAILTMEETVDMAGMSVDEFKDKLYKYIVIKTDVNSVYQLLNDENKLMSYVASEAEIKEESCIFDVDIRTDDSR